ncbi:potassium channel family protein [Clostridium sp.]|uniref:potassium channel family protein n=1 Tax=Clostridium sp. TaxID=1506 RepID=UPI003F3E8D00
MGKLVIVGTTIIVLMALIVRSIRNNRKIKTTIGRLMWEINETYKALFTERALIVKLTQGGMVLFAEAVAFVSIATSIIRYLDTYLPISVEWIIKIVASIASFIIVHYSIGYLLLVSSKIHRFIYKVENKNLKVDFILSYFITSTFLMVLLIFPDQFSENAFLGLVGVAICYYLNLKVLLTLMNNPTHVKSKSEDAASYGRVMAAAILLLIMLVLNLYLAVCFVNAIDGGAYLNATGYFDLFYYTIITFTTIGYGDIIPITPEAKIVAIIISITSVICLTVFLSSMLSYKEAPKED